MPDMIVIAGPPGGGKSTAFPVRDIGYAYFNADDEAARLNGGSYHRISPAIRAEVNRAFEAFIHRHIDLGISLAFETTLRTDVTLRQAEKAMSAGFTVAMKYVAMGSLEDHVKRVIGRAQSGGHAASEATLRRIYDGSLRNLPDALRQLDVVEVFHNVGQKPWQVMETEAGQVTFQAPAAEIPAWLRGALQGTEYEIA